MISTGKGVEQILGRKGRRSGEKCKQGKGGKDLGKEKGEALRGGKALGGKGGQGSQQGKGGKDLREEGGGGEDLREEREKIWGGKGGKDLNRKRGEGSEGGEGRKISGGERP